MTAGRVVLLTPAGVVTTSRWRTEPIHTPARNYFQYDEFAAALAEALERQVHVVEGVDDVNFERDVLLLPVLLLHEDLKVRPLARTMLLEVAPNEVGPVMRYGMLGAVTIEAMDAWRADPTAAAADALFGPVAVAERMPDGVPLTGPWGDYAYISSQEPRTLPELIAAYLRAWSDESQPPQEY